MTLKNIHFSKKKKNDSFATSIWASNAKKIYQTCWYMCRDQEIAKELQQDVFIKIFKNADQLQEIENQTAWVMRVCRNHCLDYFRKQKRLPGINLCEDVESYCGEGINLKKEMRVHLNLEQAYKNFNLLERMLIDLNFIGGLNGEELSEIFGLSRTCINIKIQKALKKARLCFKTGEE